VKKYSRDDPLTTSALLDRAAEIFAKKRFRYAQSRTRERWIDMERAGREKYRFLPCVYSAGTGFSGG
jgi:hypothetical protein